MRKSAKALVLVFAALVGSLGLTIGAAFSAAFAFGATALIVPGTGTHNVLTNTDYRNNAVDRFINPVVGCDPDSPSCTVQGVDYPAEFFPFVIFNGWCPGLQCDTWNESVDTGVTNLDGYVDPFTNPANTEDVVIFGYSQGGAVVSREMVDNLAGLDQAAKDRITVVTIGNINNPRGLFARLGFLPTIPLLNITAGPNLPTDIGIKSVNYSFEYDPVGDAPSYWGNPLAMLNAVAAFEYVHGYYLVPNANGLTDVMPYGYDNDSLAAAINDNANRKTYQDATFVLIPQRGALPMYQPVLDIGNQLGVGSLVKPLVALVNPVTKLLVNLGYDRVTNPGIPQYLSILPFNPFTFNPISFSVQFAQAIVQGVQDALGGGASLDVADTPPAMSALTSFSRLAASEPTPALAAEKNDKTVSTLAVESSGDTSAVDADAAAKAAADAAAKEAADKAAAEQAAAEQAAAKEAADKAAAEKVAEAAETEAAEKEAKAAADKAKEDEKAAAAAEKKAADKAASDTTTEAADEARQAAADSAKEAAGNDKPAGTDTTASTDAGAGAEGDKAA